MISEVVMPQMGADMTEGTVVRWLKHEGDSVQRGEIIAEIETDKANVEIEAFDSGVFRKALADEGDTVDVGTVIAVIAGAEDDIAQYGASPKKAGPAATPSAASTPQAAPSAPPPQSGAESPAAGPREPPAPPPTAVAPSTPRPSPQGAPAPAAPRANGRVRASPVARKLAQERGVDLTQVRGTGPDGRIVRRDVEAAVSGAKSPPPPQPAAPALRPGGASIVPMSKMRQTIARRMSQSKREAPHYYITVDIDMTEAEHTRHEINDALHRDAHVSVNDMIVKASAMALSAHPMFNTWLVNDEVQQHEAINICIAIALDDGLIAPAVLDCGNKRLVDIATASRDLIERAKTGALRAEEYTGGTFTVSNLGPYNVETLIAIIQPPQTAILGVGAVRETPVARDGQVVIAKMMMTALSADHRVTDGAQGAEFLSEIRKVLESPARLLL